MRPPPSVDQVHQQARNRARLNFVLGGVILLVDLFNYLRGGSVDTLFVIILIIGAMALASGVWLSTPTYLNWRLRQAGVLKEPPDPGAVGRRLAIVVIVVGLLLLVEAVLAALLWSSVGYRGPIGAALFPTAIFFVMMLVGFAAWRRKQKSALPSPSAESPR